MRVIGRAVVIMIAVACAAVGAPRPKDKDKEERTLVDAPSGEWSVERIEANGEVVRAKKPTNAEWTARFTSDMLILASGGVTIADERAAYYQNGKVFEIDLSPQYPRGMTKGIWRIDGEILMICTGKPGADRPTDFTAPKDSGRRLYTLKRK